MKTKSVLMTIEEFELASHPFGWKSEYWDGTAHFTPREHGVKVSLDLDRRELSTAHKIHPADPAYRRQMIDAFFETFYDSVEFCNWPTDKIQAHARNNIEECFDEKRGKTLEVSKMAFEPNTGDLIGLALFLINRENEAELDLLFVKPPYQGKGVATEMVAAAANELLTSGTGKIVSRYHVCNERSREWHTKFGFKELPDQAYIRMKYAWYKHEVWRNEKLGTSVNLKELEKQRDYWFGQLDDGFRY